jgi:hypothetical protein
MNNQSERSRSAELPPLVSQSEPGGIASDAEIGIVRYALKKPLFPKPVTMLACGFGRKCDVVSNILKRCGCPVLAKKVDDFGFYVFKRCLVWFTHYRVED